jgi:hypothetical protein
MASACDSALPDDVEALKALLTAARLRLQEAKADKVVVAQRAAENDAARAVAAQTSLEALIVHQKLVIEKFRRELFGSRSERGRKLLDQMELEDMEASARQDELAPRRPLRWREGLMCRSAVIPRRSRSRNTCRANG